MAETSASRWHDRLIRVDLDALVLANRTTISVVVSLVGAISLVASEAGVLPPVLSYNPILLLFGVAVMRLPLIAALRPLVDRRAGVALLAVAAYAYAVEYVGVTTGVPYGEFHYAVALGPTVAGVPLALPLLFVPLVLNAVFLVALLAPADWGRAARVGAALGVVLLVDAALDPAAVAVGFWTYAGSGAYYGVPLSNFAGWLLSGFVAVVVLDAGFRTEPLRERLAACPFALDDFVSFTLLWGALNAFYGQWIPVFVTVILALALVRADRFDVAVPTRRWRPWPIGGR